MASEVKNLIYYSGLADSLPELTQPLAAFKQLNIQETVELPPDKPDIEQLASVSTTISITSTRVIQTPAATSLEEQRLTGWKVVVEGILKQIVKYVALDTVQSVHVAHFNIPFSTYIVLPPDFETNGSISVEPFIEDIYAQPQGLRKIFKNTTLLLVCSDV